MLNMDQCYALHNYVVFITRRFRNYILQPATNFIKLCKIQMDEELLYPGLQTVF